MTHVFPQPEEIRLSEYHETQMGSVGGITKRELFAAMCLQGMLADRDEWATYNDGDNHAKWFASVAIESADALLKELEKK